MTKNNRIFILDTHRLPKSCRKVAELIDNVLNILYTELKSILTKEIKKEIVAFANSKGKNNKIFRTIWKN